WRRYAPRYAPRAAGGKASVAVGDRQLLGRKQRDHAAAVVGDHDLFFDARGRIAVLGRAIGFQREHHAFLDLRGVLGGDHAGDEGSLGEGAADAVAKLQPECAHFVGKAELRRLRPHTANPVSGYTGPDQIDGIVEPLARLLVSVVLHGGRTPDIE